MEIKCHINRKYALKNNRKSTENNAANAAKVGECGLMWPSRERLGEQCFFFQASCHQGHIV
jgi:hypothetical protein